jgi:hypothetical protein
MTLGEVVHLPSEYEVREHDFPSNIRPSLLPEAGNLRWKANPILLHRSPEQSLLQIDMGPIQSSIHPLGRMEFKP